MIESLSELSQKIGAEPGFFRDKDESAGLAAICKGSPPDSGFGIWQDRQEEVVPSGDGSQNEIHPHGRNAGSRRSGAREPISVPVLSTRVGSCASRYGPEPILH